MSPQNLGTHDQQRDQQHDQQRQQFTADLFDQVAQFDGPPEQFLDYLLRIQCEVADAEAGAVMRLNADEPPAVLALYPALERGNAAPEWLRQARDLAPRVADAAQTQAVPLNSADALYGQPDTDHIIMLPLRAGAAMRGVEAFHVHCIDSAALDQTRRTLELSTVLLGLYEMRLTLQQRSFDMDRLRQAQELLAAINEHTRFKASAMALVNELASRFQCERVSVGFLSGRYVKLAAISHIEKFTRKMDLVQDLEAAMEECSDQDVEVVHPAPPQATTVDRITRELATNHGPAAICSVPLRRERDAAGVLTLERSADRPFTVAEVETLRLTGDLVAPRLCELRETDRWFGARLAAWLRKGFAALLGPKHTWAKVLVLAVLAFVVFVTFVKGTDKVEAPFVIEAIERQVVPAPFDAYIETVSVEPNDKVTAGVTSLATLDTSELKLSLASAKAEMATFLKQADTAMRDGKAVEEQIARAEADRVAARITLLEYQISRSNITSSIDGIVLSGDLKQQLGAPVRKGDVLFEVAPLEALRAVLMVPEDRINDMRQGEKVLTGNLAAAAAPGEYVPFEVEHINPVAEVVEGQNVFRVRVKLTEPREGLAPGMEGVAKTHVGKRSYLFLWTRELIDWVRMKLWI